MIIVMAPGATEDDIQRIIQRLDDRGFGHHLSRGVERTIIGAIGARESEKHALAEQLSRLPGVERVYFGNRFCYTRFLEKKAEIPRLAERIRASGAKAILCIPHGLREAYYDEVVSAVEGSLAGLALIAVRDLGMRLQLLRGKNPSSWNSSSQRNSRF